VKGTLDMADLPNEADYSEAKDDLSDEEKKQIAASEAQL
jgi:hypothetical protein